MTTQPTTPQPPQPLADLAPQVILPQTPSLLLASSARMPEDHPYPCADVFFQFRNISCGGFSPAAAQCRVADGGLHASLTFAQVRVAGSYAILTKSVPVVDIDTAGNMMPLDRELNAPLAAGAAGGGTIPPDQQQDMLANARRQRDILSAPGNTNGQALMSSYNTHNEVYNEIFQNNAQLLSTWQQGGAVAQMAIDTHAATNATDPTNPTSSPTPLVVNDPNKLYGAPGYEKNYNGNAFDQQYSVMMACIANSGYNPWKGGDMPDNQYTQAALAALNFTKVVAITSNTSSSVNSMTASDVHQQVQSFNGTPPTSTLPELQNQVGQSTGAAGAAEQAHSAGWAILNEEERKQLHYFLIRSWEEKLQQERNVETELWSGSCHAELGEVTVQLKRHSPDASWLATAVAMPSFELDLDDRSWSGELGALVRERLSTIYFVRSLLNEKIKSFFGLAGEQLLNLPGQA